MSTAGKRKAQELARQGKVDRAIDEMREILKEAESDPYDHVYLGDLLMRAEDTEGAVQSYQTAIRSYQEVGLNRNAVAIGKKVLRIDSGRAEVHRCLAELYDTEGLHGEAIPHYLSYLDSFAGEQIPPNEFLETLEKAAAITGSKVEVALRLAEQFVRVKKGDHAASLLEDVAQHAEIAGSVDVAEELREKARAARSTTEAATSAVDAPDATQPREQSLNLGDVSLSEPLSEDSPEPGMDTVQSMPSVGGPPPPPPPPPSPVASPPGTETIEFDLDLDAEGSNPAGDASGEVPLLELDDGFELESKGASSPPESAGTDGFEVEHFPGQEGSEATIDDEIDLDVEEDGAPVISIDETASVSDLGFGEVDLDAGAEAESASGSDSGGKTLSLEEFGAVDLSASEDDDSEQAEPVWEIGSNDTAFGEVSLDSGDEEGDAPVIDINDDEIPTDALDLRPVSEVAPSGGAADPNPDSRTARDEADAVFVEGRWAQARSLYELLLAEEPADRGVLARLVEITGHLDDPAGEIQYLCRLGDAWIAEEQYEQALECFLSVTKIAPDHETARRRLARFRDMGVDFGSLDSKVSTESSLLDTGENQVQVTSGSEEGRKEDWMELEGLLEEFKDGLKNQMDASDYQAHYDLAVSHHGMGLTEEALEEVDTVLACDELPNEVERQARELRGSCLMSLNRHREAVHEYRESVDKAGADVQSRRTALYNLGRALEALEEWQEACETYTRLQVEAPGMLDVTERIRTCSGRIDGAVDSESGDEAA